VIFCGDIAGRFSFFRAFAAGGLGEEKADDAPVEEEPGPDLNFLFLRPVPDMAKIEDI
jgi:hypothetical protein